MDSLPGSTSQNRANKPASLTKLRNHFAQDLEESWTDLVLLVLCFLSGLIDSAVFNVWSCFVSMQTGNSVYVGLGVSGQPISQPYRWAKSGTAILSFAIGNFFFSRVQRYFGPKKRGTIFISFIFQTLLIALAAFLVQSGTVPGHDAGSPNKIEWIVLPPLAMLSFQSAGQIVLSRILAFGELPTVVLTSTYCDLMMDPQLFTAPIPEDPKRNRRFISIILLILGAIAGGFLTKDRSIALSLWVASAIKLGVALIWAFWKGKGAIRLD